MRVLGIIGLGLRVEGLGSRSLGFIGFRVLCLRGFLSGSHEGSRVGPWSLGLGSSWFRVFPGSSGLDLRCAGCRASVVEGAFVSPILLPGP